MSKYIRCKNIPSSNEITDLIRVGRQGCDPRLAEQPELHAGDVQLVGELHRLLHLWGEVQEDFLQAILSPG